MGTTTKLSHSVPPSTVPDPGRSKPGLRTTLAVVLLVGLFVIGHLPGLGAALFRRSTTQPAQQQTDVRIKPSQTTIDKSITEDKEVKDLIEKYSDRMRSEMRAVIGRAAIDLDKGLGGGPLGAFVTDVMRVRAEQSTGKQVHLALQNSGGLRRSIARGDITVGTIFEVMPFENQIIICELTGEQLLRLVERIVERSSERSSDALSGAQITACQGKVRQVTVDGEPINPRATYRLATSDYLQQGGSGYEVLGEARNVTPTGITIRQALIDFIRAEHAAKRAIQNRAEGRFRVDCGPGSA